MTADPKKPGRLTLVFDKKRDIDILQDLASHEEVTTMARIAITFNGTLPSGSFPRSDGTPSFTHWCMDHDVVFLDWRENAANIMIEAKRFEIFECLVRNVFDVDKVTPKETWMAVVERDEDGIKSAVSLDLYMQP